MLNVMYLTNLVFNYRWCRRGSTSSTSSKWALDALQQLKKQNASPLLAIMTTFRVASSRRCVGDVEQFTDGAVW